MADPPQVVREHLAQLLDARLLEQQQPARLVEQHRVARQLVEEACVQPRDLADPLGGRRAAGQLRQVLVVEGLHALGDELGDERLLGGEVVVEGALAEVGALGDVLDAGAVDTALREQRHRGLHQRGARLLLLSLPAAFDWFLTHGRKRISTMKQVAPHTAIVG